MSDVIQINDEWRIRRETFWCIERTCPNGWVIESTQWNLDGATVACIGAMALSRAYGGTNPAYAINQARDEVFAAVRKWEVERG